MKASILADIGNSSYRLLYFLEGERKLLQAYDFESLKEIVKEMALDLAGKEGEVYVSSVNGFKKSALSSLLEKVGYKTVFLAPTDLYPKAQIKGISIVNIDRLGSDLFFDLLAGGPSSLIADYGTASKILGLDKSGVFLGGMIGPGLRMANASLAKGTDLLGDYVPCVPPGYFSYETGDAINASATFGEAFKLIGVLKKAKEDLKDPSLKLILTGGDGDKVQQALLKLGYDEGSYDPLWLFRGMAYGLDMEDVFFKGER